MSTTELKLEIINKITSITDTEILSEIYRLVNLESNMETSYKLSEEGKKAIELGLKDVKEGRLYSNEQADNLIQEWLKK
jgi:predicted AAA+ superfamily ATPase